MERAAEMWLNIDWLIVYMHLVILHHKFDVKYDETLKTIETHESEWQRGERKKGEIIKIPKSERVVIFICGIVTKKVV